MSKTDTEFWLFQTRLDLLMVQALLAALLGAHYCMFANLIEDIIDASGGTDHDYDLREIGNQKSVRYDTAAPLDKPATLTISHVETGKGDGLYRNTLVRFDAVVERSEDQVQGTNSVYLVVRTPVKVSSTTDITKLLYQMYDFLGTAGYQTKIIAGEI